MSCPCSLRIVPGGTKRFYALINGVGVTADLISPEGEAVGRIDTRAASPARVDVAGDESRAGLWELRLDKLPGRGERPVYVVLDPKLSQWFSVDPTHPLKVSDPR